MPISPRVYHALQRFCPEIEPGAQGMEYCTPLRCCILMGVAFSWRCIRRLSVLFRYFSSAGLSMLPSGRRVPLLCALGRSLCATSLFAPLSPIS